jgi:hypothetical protein
MMSVMPVGGVVWQTIQYLIGFQRLGYDVYYIEEHSRPANALMQDEAADANVLAAAFIAHTMNGIDLGNSWAYRPEPKGGSHFGLNEREVDRLYVEADLIINLHGSTTPLSHHAEGHRLIYLETDPVELQIEVYNDLQTTIDFLDQHIAFFTYGENYGNPDCLLPVSDRFSFLPTRQPIVMDFWDSTEESAELPFTTIGNWRQDSRPIVFQGETYHWSKHLEFLKFLDLPRRSSQTFELALSSCHVRARDKLKRHGWRVRDAGEVSLDPDSYRTYLLHSRAEFTVAKDQNVRLRSGWFSDRSASYLALGKPVVTQETGFSNILPTGQGLFGFSTLDEILAAVEAINADYKSHSRAARTIAREFFSYDVVLPQILAAVGM